MKTNFFSTITELILNKGISITITLSKDGDKIVTAFKPQYQKDEKARINNIRPIMLTHSAEALDESFFETITEPVNTFIDTAKEIENWKDSLKVVKEAEQKKEEKKPKEETKPASSSKKKKKAKPAKAKEVAPPPETKTAEQKQEEINLKKATAIAAHGKTRYEAGDLKAALMHYKKAFGIMALDGWRDEIARLEKMIEENERLEADRKKEELNRKASNYINTAAGALKGQDFQTCARNWMEAFKLTPENPRLEEIKQSIIEKLGEPTTKTLLQLK